MSVTFNHSNELRLTGGGISSLTLSISAAAGQLAVVCGFPSGGSSSTPVNSITDNGSGNTWAIPGNYSGNMAIYTGGSGAFIAYCNVSSGFTSITVNIPTASEFTVCCGVFIGAKTSFPLRQATDGLTPSESLSCLGGGLCVGAANTSSATSISGLSTMTTDRGNCAGYGLPGYDHTVTFSWSPSQNAPAVFAEFYAQTAVTIHGTATLSDAESLSGKTTIGPVATLTDAESLTAVSGITPQPAFSAITPDQLDPYGVPLIHGLTSYHWPSTTSTDYDYWMSLQDGQLGAGLYNADRNSGLTVSSSVPTWTDSGGKTLGMVRTYSADSTSNLATFTTETDVPGASVSVVVTGSNATVVVQGQFDFSVLNPSNTILMIGYLNWNGSDRTQQAVMQAPPVSGAVRSCNGRTWRITGVTAGTYTAKLRASCNISSANNVVEYPHTGLVVTVIDQ